MRKSNKNIFSNQYIMSNPNIIMSSFDVKLRIDTNIFEFRKIIKAYKGFLKRYRPNVHTQNQQNKQYITKIDKIIENINNLEKKLKKVYKIKQVDNLIKQYETIKQNIETNEGKYLVFKPPPRDRRYHDETIYPLIKGNRMRFGNKTDLQYKKR